MCATVWKQRQKRLLMFVADLNNNLNHQTEISHSLCFNNIINGEPTEFVIRIKPFNNHLIGREILFIPSHTETGIINTEDWFLTGLNIRLFLAHKHHKINVKLHPHPILAFGFFIIIDSNPLLPGGKVIYEPPNHKFTRGVGLKFDFSL